MKSLLKIELFNDNIRSEIKFWSGIISGTCGKGVGAYFKDEMPRPWVAEILGLDNKFKYKRDFLSCHKDYSQSNSVGSRGIYLHYHLDEGKLYEVNEQLSWKRWDRYFCIVENGKIIKITEWEVKKWLNDRSE